MDITDSELKRARALSPMLRPVNRLVKHKSTPQRRPKYIPHALNLTKQEMSSAFRTKFCPVFSPDGLLYQLTPPQSTPDAQQLYLSAAAAALTQIEILDATAAQTLQKVIDYLSAEARFGTIDVQKLVKTRDDGWKNADSLRSKLDELEQKVEVDQQKFKELRMLHSQVMGDFDAQQAKIMSLEGATERQRLEILGHEKTIRNHVLQAQEFFSEKLALSRSNIAICGEMTQLRSRFEAALKARIKAEKQEKTWQLQGEQLQNRLLLEAERNAHLLKEAHNMQHQVDNNMQNIAAARGEVEFDLQELEAENTHLRVQNDGLKGEIYQAYMATEGACTVSKAEVVGQIPQLFSTAQYGGGRYTRNAAAPQDFTQQCYISVKKLPACLVDEMQDERKLDDIIDLIDLELSDTSEDFLAENFEISDSISETDQQGSLKVKIKQKFVSKKAAKQIYDEMLKFKARYKKYKANYVKSQISQSLETAKAEQRVLAAFQGAVSAEIDKMKALKQPQKVQFRGILDIVGTAFNLRALNAVKVLQAQHASVLEQLTRFGGDSVLAEIPKFQMRKNTKLGVDFTQQLRNFEEVHVSICKKCEQLLAGSEAGAQIFYAENVIYGGGGAGDLLQEMERKRAGEVETDEIAKKRTKRLLDYKKVRNRMLENYKEQIQCVADIADCKEKVYKNQNVQNLEDHMIFQQYKEKLIILKQEESTLAVQFENVRDTYLIQRAPIVERLSEQNGEVQKGVSKLQKMNTMMTEIEGLRDEVYERWNGSSQNKVYSQQENNKGEPMKTSRQSVNIDQKKQNSTNSLFRNQDSKLVDLDDKLSQQKKKVVQLLEKSQYLTEQDMKAINFAINIQHNVPMQQKSLEQVILIPEKTYISPQIKSANKFVYQQDNNPFKKLVKIRELIKEGQKYQLVKGQLDIKKKIFRLQKKQQAMTRNLLLKNKIFSSGFQAKLQFETVQDYINSNCNLKMIESLGENIIIPDNVNIQQVNNKLIIISSMTQIQWIDFHFIEQFLTKNKSNLPFIPVQNSQLRQYAKLPCSTYIPTSLWLSKTIRTARLEMKNGDFGKSFINWAKYNYGISSIYSKLISSILVGIYQYQTFEALIFLTQLNYGIEIEIIDELFQKLESFTNSELNSLEQENITYDQGELQQYIYDNGFDFSLESNNIFEVIFKQAAEILHLQAGFTVNLLQYFKLQSNNNVMSIQKFKYFYEALGVISDKNVLLAVFQCQNVTLEDFSNLMKHSVFQDQSIIGTATMRLALADSVIESRQLNHFSEQRDEVFQAIKLNNAVRAATLAGKLLKMVNE
ncbi:hypothetical protein SS50377_26502 [Spironucleus salmonicida]|uniref:Uncharacterized protein n=1 Tax=Spironucleus salmonicida TaxID=348837 RepID=V6LAD0_9EUKA|nr:hypothetical protein SS50377_26502 [Spironucleus salmonicida]|eukprot:EST41357.1 Hypothetical protein SS50377_19071 [Spironucleus salmonicida]